MAVHVGWTDRPHLLHLMELGSVNLRGRNSKQIRQKFTHHRQMVETRSLDGVGVARLVAIASSATLASYLAFRSAVFFFRPEVEEFGLTALEFIQRLQHSYLHWKVWMWKRQIKPVRWRTSKSLLESFLCQAIQKKVFTSPNTEIFKGWRRWLHCGGSESVYTPFTAAKSTVSTDRWLRWLSRMSKTGEAGIGLANARNAAYLERMLYHSESFAKVAVPKEALSR